MSEIVIRVENLGKQYRIGLKQTKRNFQETLLYSFSAPIRWMRGERDIAETFWALENISFEIKQGEAVGIIGRNGAGKSTLLKILSRITKPTKGRVDLYGRVASLLEVGTGFHSELSGRDNIYLNGAILGMSRREIKRKFDEIVDFSGVEKFLDTPVKHYSSGMYVRLAFSVAAHLEPEILIVDEVLAVGDAEFQKKCLGKMGDVAREGRTVLFVSHNLAAVSRLCDKGIVLRDGQAAYYGTAAGAIEHYLGASPLNQTTRSEWNASDNRKHHFSDVIQIKKLYITNQAGDVYRGILLTSRTYEAVVEINLVKPDPNLIIALAYYGSDQSLLLMTNIRDTIDIDFNRMRPGEYRLSVPIPVELFSNGKCFLEILCVINMSGWVLLPDNESRITIEFFRDINPTTEILIPGTLQPLSPMLVWKASSIN